MPYPCPPQLRTLLDLVNATVNYDMRVIESEKSLRYELKWPKWIGVGLCHANTFPDEFRRFIWTGEIVPPPTYSRGDLILNGKPAKADEIEEAIERYNEYPKTEIENALRRYNMIRVARKMLHTIVDLSEKPDPKRSVDGIRLVKSQSEYEIEIVGAGYDEELKDALSGRAARIRKCGAIKCLKYFWFGRSDAKGCSKKCSSAISTAKKRR